MNAAAATRLAFNARAVRGLIEGCSNEQLRWQPASGTWSLLEILNHLTDEDALDFRTRLDFTLHHPGLEWPAIDPPSWVLEMKYNEQDVNDSLQRFLTGREQSIAWLKHLQEPAWTNAYEHPIIGRMTAADVLHSWLAHDALHIRQMSQRHYQWLGRSGHRTDYAGSW